MRAGDKFIKKDSNGDLTEYLIRGVVNGLAVLKQTRNDSNALSFKYMVMHPEDMKEDGFSLVQVCKKCGGDAKPSKGYGNAYLKEENGTTTEWQGRGNLIDVQKCSECGHSWT